MCVKLTKSAEKQVEKRGRERVCEREKRDREREREREREKREREKYY